MLHNNTCNACGKEKTEVFTTYITRNGKRIYPKGKVFHFFACNCKKP